MIVMDFPDQRKRCHQYVDALEEERRKIKVFQRELPLCFELVTQAIDACRRDLSGTTTEYNMPGQSECSEHTSSGGPVLEEFIPIKPHNDDDQDENQDNNNSAHHEEDDNDYHFQDERSLKRTRDDDNKDEEDINKEKMNDHKKKSEWLRSVQLWNQSPDPPSVREDVPRKAVVKEVKRSNGGGGAFQPFQKEKSSCVGKSNSANHDKIAVVAKPAAAAAMSSNAETAAAAATAGVAAGAGTSGGGSISISNNNNSNSHKTKDHVDKERQAQRKQRRCWSPELHRRFLHALQQLGGSHAATPKQIRELMKVDGLSNDEVKSHLQKYRLHTRRPSHAIQNNSHQQGPQFVVVGGIWVPPPAEYAATAPGGMYAPIAPAIVVTDKKQQTRSSERGGGSSSHSDGGGAHSCSPTTSSSTHTATSPPAI